MGKSVLEDVILFTFNLTLLLKEIDKKGAKEIALEKKTRRKTHRKRRKSLTKGQPQGYIHTPRRPIRLQHMHQRATSPPTGREENRCNASTDYISSRIYGMPLRCTQDIFGPIGFYRCLHRLYLLLSFRERLRIHPRKIERSYMLSKQETCHKQSRRSHRHGERWTLQ
jgi:hypothetical protein